MSDNHTLEQQVARSIPRGRNPSRVRIYFWPKDFIGDPPEHVWTAEDDGVACEFCEWLESRGYEVIVEEDSN